MLSGGILGPFAQQYNDFGHTYFGHPNMRNINRSFDSF